LNLDIEQMIIQRIDVAQELASKTKDLLNFWGGNYEVLENRIEAAKSIYKFSILKNIIGNK